MISFARAQPRFRPGDRVRHRRYAYRGIVVDVDRNCAAPEDWYLRNRTQPPREQPWYHVLVDGAQHATYPAESSLKADDSREAIEHPLLARYFDLAADGTYQRNQEPWDAPW